jgi:amidase
VTGIRPTMGRVPRSNGSDPRATPLFSDLIAVGGVLARRVRDLRIGLAALAVGDASDPLWVPAPLDGPPVVGPIRVFLVTEATGLFVHDSVRAAVRQAGAALAEAGYAVQEAKPPSIEAAALLRARLSAADLRNRLMDRMRELADQDMIRHVDLFLEATDPFASQGEYQDALAQVMSHRREWDRFLAGRSLVVGPNSGDLPFAIGLETRDLAAMRHILASQSLMTAVNLLGLPAVAVQTGFVPAPDAPHGLPMGVQIIGPRFREDLTLAAAEAIEARLPAAMPIDPVI